MIFWSISWEDGSHRTDWMGMKTPCLGAHSGSLKKTLVAQTHNLDAPGAWVPVRQQPCIQKQQISNFSNYESSRWQFSQKTAGDLKQTDHLSKGSVELLWLHKMMCLYKRTHLSHTATNVCNLWVGTRWQGSQTDSVKWQWDHVTILVHHPSTSFPNLYNSCFTWGYIYCHSVSVAVNCYLILHNNQINVRALIDQSAMGYCAGKPMEKSRVFFWACGSWFTNSSCVLPTSQVVYQFITHRNLWSIA